MTNLIDKGRWMLRNPTQITSRFKNKLDSWRDRTSRLSSLSDDAENLEACLFRMVGSEYQDYFAAETFRNLEKHLTSRQERLVGGTAPFTLLHNGTLTLGRLCYAICRKLKPRVIVETGVAYGVTSSYILQSIHDNGFGKLYSIDLPPLGDQAEKYVGCLIPEQLRSHWELIVGASQEALGPLLRYLGSLDVFIHDSLHTYSHMKWEFESVLPLMRCGSFLIADDIGFNKAFEEIAARPRVDSWCAVKQNEKDALCGIIRLG